MSMSSFLCTVFTDPGFLPPGLDSVAAAGGRNEGGGGGNGTFETHDQRNLLDASYPFSSELPQIQNKDVLIHGFSLRLKNLVQLWAQYILGGVYIFDHVAGWWTIGYAFILDRKESYNSRAYTIIVRIGAC
ncbi:hypothetical protein MP638_003881 [Amoeboaphelidium occidentale]|nr:hypothetical protein MP638_003881 [Amoeboaphelidium occidentale]